MTPDKAPLVTQRKFFNSTLNSMPKSYSMIEELSVAACLYCYVALNTTKIKYHPKSHQRKTFY
jgi:hypothetical protein